MTQRSQRQDATIPRPGLGTKSLSRDLAISLTLLLLVFASVLSGVGYYKQSRSMRLDMEAKADDAVQRIAGILSVPMWNVDHVSVGLIVSVFGQNEIVESIQILDPSGELVASYGRVASQRPGIARKGDILHRGRTIGTVKMSFSLRPHEKRLERLLYVSLWTTLGAVVVVLTATGLLMRTVIRKPLADLRDGIRRVAKGDYSHSFANVQDAELKDIAWHVREMSAEIAAREKDLQAMNEALVEAEEQYRSIFENSLVGIFVFTPTGRVLRCNPAMAQLFGYSSEGELKDAVEDVAENLFVDPADWESVLQHIREKESVALYESRFRRRDGSLLWGAITGRAVRNPEGLLVGVEGMLGDVTERKKAQNELADLNRHLESLVGERTRDLADKAEELERANERLMALDRMKSAFLSSVSHELRTPLTSILGFAKLLNRDFRKHFFDKAGEDAALVIKGRRMMDNLAIIEREGSRLTRLINDVLDLNKIESGRVEWNDCELNPEDLAKRVAAAVQGFLSEKPAIQFQLDLGVNLPSLYADPDRIEQVLINLVNNSVKFTDEGTVTLQVYAAAGGLLEFCVRDTGSGIPPEDLGRVFEKFQQLRATDTLQDKPKGTGLGLTICREIVEHYGGSIWAESTKGEGAAFYVQLPTGIPVSDSVESCPEDESMMPLPPQGLIDENAPLILVVDDDPAVNSYLSQIFEGEGFRVARAFDGASALESAKALSPDLITMDIMMPIMDGRTAISHLRGDAKLGTIPILVVSVVKDNDLGADATLEKPIDVERLLGTVHGLLGRHECSQPLMVINEFDAKRITAPVTLCSGSIENCSPEEMWERVRDGFRGTIILPFGSEGRINVSELAMREGVSVLILPDGLEV